ncbi:transcriptional repressor LexA [Clostridium thermarum]|uniref:transcriptional repressor LexA n=1 Tax=Clostridium thermarum TaxID=1716543 RepID=UPI0015D668C5|nr:transcriptional repressor LexA [Clostridium thermarum]
MAGSGKTTVAVNRILFLLENYCLEKDDRVLMVTYNKSLINYIKYVYDKVQNEREYEKISLFEIDNSIAAGNPNLINSEVEEEFYIPQRWLSPTGNFYMVKVKGDSMINANIHDGDIVVIKQQCVANNYDIVAVHLDGNATLKRFVRMGSTILLMPENPAYEPIPVNEGQMEVLGVAVGVVKQE